MANEQVDTSYDVLLCSICFLEYNTTTRKPKLLTCLKHSICQECLTGILAKGNPCCPLCRKSLSLESPATDNMSLIEIIDINKGQQVYNEKQEMCGQCILQSILSLCNKCDNKFCNQCIAIHTMKHVWNELVQENMKKHSSHYTSLEEKLHKQIDDDITKLTQSLKNHGEQLKQQVKDQTTSEHQQKEKEIKAQVEQVAMCANKEKLQEKVAEQRALNAGPIESKVTYISRVQSAMTNIRIGDVRMTTVKKKHCICNPWFWVIPVCIFAVTIMYAGITRSEPKQKLEVHNISIVDEPYRLTFTGQGYLLILSDVNPRTVTCLKVDQDGNNMYPRRMWSTSPEKGNQYNDVTYSSNGVWVVGRSVAYDVIITQLCEETGVVKHEIKLDKFWRATSCCPSDQGIYILVKNGDEVIYLLELVNGVVVKEHFLEEINSWQWVCNMHAYSKTVVIMCHEKVYIYELDSAGYAVHSSAILDTAHGLVKPGGVYCDVKRNLLLIAENSKPPSIHVYSLASKEYLFNIPVPGEGALNVLSLSEKGDIAVSDWEDDKVYMIQGWVSLIP